MAEIKFYKEHTWVRPEGDIGTVGLSHYAQEQMGQIIYVDLPEEGREITAGEEFGALESNKVASDLIAPVSGEVLESNPALENQPALINDSPYDQGWITKVRLSSPEELDGLMDEAAYLKLVSG